MAVRAHALWTVAPSDEGAMERHAECQDQLIPARPRANPLCRLPDDR